MGGGALEKRFHLGKWLTIFTKKRKVGLGIQSHPLLNKTFLDKWSWRYTPKRGALWRQLISGQYGEEKERGIDLVLQEMGMVLGYEKLSGRIVISFMVKFLFMYFFPIIIHFSLIKRGLGGT